MSRPPAYPRLEEFAAGFDFTFDDFQTTACRAVERGQGVLVAAPTGAGKTIVGEFAVHLALATGRKACYTTPIKALSNQKYLDLCRRYGPDRVGLLTGDSSINGEAPVVVMTTEVLRNMLYAGSATLAGLGYVVMDEVHYLADRFRGPVWEEVIIQLPDDVLVVSLSATVSNAEEFGAWLGEVRGGAANGKDTSGGETSGGEATGGGVEIIVSEHRPVPLWQHLLVGRQLYDLFVDDSETGRINPELWARLRRETGNPGSERPGATRGGGRHPRAARGHQLPSRQQELESLDRAGLLPAISFIFSRAGCDAAVAQLLHSGVRLIPAEEGEQIRRLVEERVMGLAHDDLDVLGYRDFVDGLTRGYAAHHAGMLPTFREIVEELFSAGRVRAVFATETLALGINMPARTVLLKKLVKFNGEQHADLTPAEYTQLTGRAGRRGIDIEGHAVVVWRPGLDPAAVAGLASTRTYPLDSSFRPTYNMAVNLVAQVGRDRARGVLEASFAQFQADRAVAGLLRTLRRNARQLDEYAAAMVCEAGDFGEYAGLREQLRTLEKSSSQAAAARRRTAVADSLARLRIGDVIWVPAGRRAGWAVVVTPATARPGRGRGAGGTAGPWVVTMDRRLRRLTATDVPTAVHVETQLRVPKHVNTNSPKDRKDLAASLRNAVRGRPVPSPREGFARQQAGGSDDQRRIHELRAQLRAHPVHGCPRREEHARWAEKWWRVRRESDRIERTVEGRTNNVARTFDRICALLEQRGYLGDSGDAVTEAGARLRRLYTDKDLLTAECLRQDVWRQVGPAGLAACVSALVHEPRGDAAQSSRRQPPIDVTEALEAMTAIWDELHQQERRHGLPTTPPPEPGIAWMLHAWATGQRLEVVLRGSELAAGDFVRRCKQVVDVLGQLAIVAPHPALAAKARKAGDAVLRGVVAADRLD
ncbi:MAG: RNA helicase [Actinomycetales bacterium]|nr:MAG: RNA helicase [Actinomycetales bacterium]